MSTVLVTVTEPNVMQSSLVFFPSGSR